MTAPWLQRLTRGEALIAIALTEPRGGSDAANLRLRIERVGAEYVIDGEKASISAADQADAVVVFGRTGTVESGAHGVTALFVPTDATGLTRSRLDCHGQRAIGRGSLFFENVRVPVSHRLGDENKGFVQVMQGFDYSRALIGLQVLAVARVALEETWAHVAQREAFDRPLAAFQGVSHPLAELDTQVEAARLLCLQALWLKDRGAPHSAEAAMCKWWAPKIAYETLHQCLLMHGHGGYDRGPKEESPLPVFPAFLAGGNGGEQKKTPTPPPPAPPPRRPPGRAAGGSGEKKNLLQKKPPGTTPPPRPPPPRPRNGAGRTPLRWPDRARRSRPSSAPRRDLRPRRPERQRQDDPGQCDHRLLSAATRSHPARTAATSPAWRRMQVARLGVARTFQNLALFNGMTVLDNILLGRHVHMRPSVLRTALYSLLARRDETENRVIVEEVIDFLQLEACATSSSTSFRSA